MMLNVSHDAVKEKRVVDKKELWIRYEGSTESFVFLFIAFHLLQRMK